jgi:AmpE protein
VEGEAVAQVPSATGDGARRLLAALDWPVAQLMTLSLALVGNFDTVLAAWREAGGASMSLDNRFLGAVARASVRSELVEEASDYADENGVVPARYMAVATDLPELRDAMSLVWRCLLVWLAVLALFVIAGWAS